MKDKVLVAYATARGSTKQTAEAIGYILRQRGVAVDVLPISEVKDVSGYRAVVLGSAIYLGEWMTEAVNFVRQHQHALNDLPVALFTVCLTMSDDTQKSRLTVLGYLDTVLEYLPQVKDEDIGLFPGVFQSSKWQIPLRWAVKFIVKLPEGDYRRWDEVHQWADYIARRVINRRPQPELAL
jgi:menaquinone-dependent protoporphyrinogen oxidase